MTIVILGDTHMPRGARVIPPRCLRALEEAELIIHTGDFTGITVLEQLTLIGPPLLAVSGNVDEPAVVDRLQGTEEVEHRGTRIGLIHDAGPARGRLERMRQRFPNAQSVVFGHSHMPLLQRDEDGFQIFNPGSPTERRRAKRASFGLAEAGPARRLEFKHVWL